VIPNLNQDIKVETPDKKIIEQIRVDKIQNIQTDKNNTLGFYQLPAYKSKTIRNSNFYRK